jgi:hypothetical protein
MSSMPEPMPEPSDDELGALADKYQTLALLRAARDGTELEPPRETLRALAERHPGALRELDTLGLPELQRRARMARAAAAGGPREPWMGWITSFHRLMAAALLVKGEAAQGRRARTAPVELSPSLPGRASATAGFTLDEALVATLAHPPGGRLLPLVMAELARRFGVDARELAEALFPGRRPSPYRLG